MQIEYLLLMADYEESAVGTHFFAVANRFHCHVFPAPEGPRVVALKVTGTAFARDVPQRALAALIDPDGNESKVGEGMVRAVPLGGALSAWAFIRIRLGFPVPGNYRIRVTLENGAAQDLELSVSRVR